MQGDTTFTRRPAPSETQDRSDLTFSNIKDILDESITATPQPLLTAIRSRKEVSPRKSTKTIDNALNEGYVPNIVDSERINFGDIRTFTAWPMDGPQGGDETLVKILEARLKQAGCDASQAGDLLRWLDAGIAIVAAGQSLTSALRRLRSIFKPAAAAACDRSIALPFGIRRPYPKELPALPKGLSWPTEKYSGSPESKRGGGGIVAFLDRVWREVLQGAPDVIDMPTLRLVDRSAAKGIDNLTQKTDPVTGKRKSLPKHIDIPTKPQVTDREAERYPTSSERPARLDRTLRSRAWRASKRIG